MNQICSTDDLYKATNPRHWHFMLACGVRSALSGLVAEGVVTRITNDRLPLAQRGQCAGAGLVSNGEYIVARWSDLGYAALANVLEMATALWALSDCRRFPELSTRWTTLQHFSKW